MVQGDKVVYGQTVRAGGLVRLIGHRDVMMMMLVFHIRACNEMLIVSVSMFP